MTSPGTNAARKPAKLLHAGVPRGTICSMSAFARAKLANPLWFALLAVLLLGCLLPGCGSEPDPEAPTVPPFDWDIVAQKPRGPRPYFSFFVTTQEGLLSLPSGQWAPAPDPINGYGGDFG